MLICKRPLGVLIFGILLIITSIDTLRHMPGYDFYRLVNHEWPENIIKIRYAGSWVFRLLGLASGIGILCLSNAFRKFLVGFSYYCLITLPLRHTYNSMLFFTDPIYNQYGSSFTLPTFTWICVAIRCTIDAIFSIALIYYLTRPKVISHFQ